MGIFYFPTNFVYWQKVNNHDKIKENLVPKIENLRATRFKDNKPGLINASTNYNGGDDNILSTNEHNMIKHIVWDPIDAALNEINSRSNTKHINFQESIIGNSWYTYYELDGKFEYHSHHSGDSLFRDGKTYRPTLSLIYILRDENKDNATSFMETAHERISTTNEIDTYFYTGNEHDINEGCVLIFPSSLYHMVNQVKIPGRITIAVNIYSRFA
jgi:hypothetical protein